MTCPLSETDGAPCTRDDQCGVDAAAAGLRCFAGHCTRDQCLTDADCGGGVVCLCSGPPYGNPNACGAKGNCRVDADCGPGGYCSPGNGYRSQGDFYCHTPADTCVNPAVDCGGCLRQTGTSAVCSYFPDKKAFGCEQLCDGSGG
jgi:hypothetical protein